MLSRFIDYLRLELNRSPHTIEAYKRDIVQFRDWLTEDSTDIDFISVTQSDVRAWFAFLARSGDTPRTIRRKSTSLKTFYKWMIKTNYIKSSPLRDIPLPKLPKQLPDLVKPAEVEDVLTKTKNDSNKDELKNILDSLIIEMLYSLGIRRAELIGINDSDISFSNAEIKVTGKRSKQRIIPIPQDLLKKINDWQIKRDKDGKQLGDSPLFIIKGKRITANQVYYIVHKSLVTSSAKKRSPHALRHTFASSMLNGGAELDSVREFLGHASLDTTQIYTHVSFNEIKKAYSQAHPRSSKRKN